MRRRAGRIVRLRYVAHYARLSKRDMLGARPLRPLALFERHGLPFAEVVEADALARGLMEEVSLPSWAATKPNPLSVTSRLIVPLVAAIENTPAIQIGAARREIAPTVWL